MAASQGAASQGHSRANAGLFIGIVIAGAAVIALALIGGGAPISAGIYLNDWIDWARISPSMSGLLVLGVVMVLIGIVGTLVSLMAPKPQSRKLTTQKPAPPIARKVAEASAAPVALAAAVAAEAVATETPPLPQLVADNTRKASLRFEAAPTPAPASELEAAVETEVEAAPVISAEIIPFRTDTVHAEPQADAATSEAPAETQPETLAETVDSVAEAAAADPIAAALLQDGPEARTAPEATADINAVI
ncbi:MAG: hypothetical protein QM667_02530, partial [Asticcacaulis sp.]